MIIGIDIGGTTSKIGVVKDGRVQATLRVPTTGHADEHAFADALTAAVKELAAGQQEAITGIGIGAPNANQYAGIIELAPNLPWKHDVPLASMVERRTGIRTVLGNDANAAALGEWRYGAGQGLHDMLMVTLGTGVGSGFITNGQLVLGSHGNAGEIGHMTIVIDGRECTCGRKGCLEAYVSIRGLRRTYEELDGDPAILEEPGVLCIAKAAQQGDQAALQTFRHAARWLGVGLANAVAVTGPARIVLFGGIARNGELLMAPLREWFQRSLLNIYHGRVDLVASALPDDDAAILGAAALTTL
ncbi:MAG: ROK family protein [Flavobacteriales bacterium]|nr:ROK family protein [Flavobacteriales bacterium]MCL4281150.1 ROK family protein [Flavobacteriales bacterium]